MSTTTTPKSTAADAKLLAFARYAVDSANTVDMEGKTIEEGAIALLAAFNAGYKTKKRAPPTVTCDGQTLKGEGCKRSPLKGFKYCKAHSNDDGSMKSVVAKPTVVREMCTATTKAGVPCKKYAIVETEFCSIHGKMEAADTESIESAKSEKSAEKRASAEERKVERDAIKAAEKVEKAAKKAAEKEEKALEKEASKKAARAEKAANHLEVAEAVETVEESQSLSTEDILESLDF